MEMYDFHLWKYELYINFLYIYIIQINVYTYLYTEKDDISQLSELNTFKPGKTTISFTLFIR